MSAPRGARGRILVVDKPRGPTSHDVVGWARRALGTRAVGHAGTLDPMATGILVLGIDEGTKLLPYLTSEDKVYETTVTLGAETHTLDAEGTITETAPVPPLDADTVRAAARAFLGTMLQRAPAVSAIKQDGVALHERVRRGDVVVAPEREVRCDAIDVLEVGAGTIALRIECGKGFYVRSLGRDLARALGTRGHLSALRRLRSGALSLEAAVPGEVLGAARTDQEARAVVRAACLTLEAAVSFLPAVHLDASAARDVGHGKPLVRPVETTGPVALFGPDGDLLAISRWNEGALRVLRGFRSESADGTGVGA